MPRSINFRKGVGTGFPRSLGRMPQPDPSLAHALYDDFDKYTAADWALVGTGTPTRAIQDGVDGGVLRLGNSAASGDANGIRWAGGAGAARNTFTLTAGKRMGFKTRLAVNAATTVTLNFGFSDTTHQNAITAGNAIALQATAAGWTLVVYTGGVASRIDLAGAAPALDTSYAVYSITYDGAAVRAYRNSQFFASCSVSLPSAAMAPFFSVRNGAASARNIDIDYFVAMKDR